MTTDPLHNILAKTYVQDLLFLLVHRFAFLALPQVRKLQYPDYDRIALRKTPPASRYRSIGVDPGVEYDRPPGPRGGRDEGRAELGLLERAGILRRFQATVGWPPPSALQPGELVVLRDSSEPDSDEEVMRGFEDVIASNSAHFVPRGATGQLPLRLYTATESTRDHIAGPHRHAVAGDVSFSGFDASAFDEQLLEPRLYVADAVLRTWFNHGYLEPCRYHMGSRVGEPHLVSVGEEVERKLYFLRFEKLVDYLATYKAAVGFFHTEPKLHFEMR